MSKSWVKQVHSITIGDRSDIDIYIDDTFEVVDKVEGLKTTLFPHQKPVVKAMMDLEMNRVLKSAIFDADCDIVTSAGILSEAVGSGKTIDILALILLQKTPLVYPDISELQLTDDLFNRRRGNGVKTQYISSVKRSYKNIIKPTLIFAGVSVVDQWISAITKFTSLKYFAVFDVRSLQKLINIIENKEVNYFDIILVKNGKISRPIKFPADVIIEDKNHDKTILYIFNVLANACRALCWSRIVLDDFDTIQIPPNAGKFNALFTWYISSTRKCMEKRNIENRQFKTTSELLMYGNYSCNEVMKNRILFNTINIRNDSDFVKRTNNISSPKFYVYIFINPNNQYMGLLGAMENAEANEVMEMLNSDAISTAAERLGINTDNVADIFELMLGKQYDFYKKSINVLDFINEIEPMQGQRRPMSENPDEDDTYKKSDLFIRRPVEYNYPNLKGILESTKEEYTIIKNSSGIAIERVKNNIKDGECPICLSDLSDEEDIIILKCCGTILCGICCFGVVFPKKSAFGQCSKCRNKLNLKSLIYLNSGFDLTKIVDDKIEDVSEKSQPIPSYDKTRSKMAAIVEIIKNVIPAERKRVDVNIPNLMKGTFIHPEVSYNKVLIFANYDETIGKIKKSLEEEKISYYQLGGTHNEISETVAKFTDCNARCVLIINSTKHSAGINLQTATDIIFMHKIIDPNIETQVIGRGQRIGRTSTLRVHYMFYQNEFDWMNRNAAIREIPDSDENEINLREGIINGLQNSAAPAISNPLLEYDVSDESD